MGSGVRAKNDPAESVPPGFLALDPDHPDVAAILHQGRVEDDYEVEREPIARGKFAAVRRARHRLTGEIFAAKYVRRRRRAKTEEAEAEARHETAVLVLGRHHPHIAHLHRVYQTRQEYIIILEFGAGGDLQKLLDDQMSLPEHTARGLMLQVLTGLRFLHSNHIAHLDIKPQNLIMMDPSHLAGVKLVDFGLSRVISQDTELTQIMGTPDYVAPEVINFEPVGLATDMWAIGVLTYVFLTGLTPFGGDTDQETFVNITQGEYDFHEDSFVGVSEQAKDFISCLLLKKPKERLTVDDCLNHPWICPSVLNSVYPSEPPGLYTLQESDPHDCAYLGDSAYSSDSNNGSPTFLEQPSPNTFTSSLTVSNLLHCPIPEEQQQQQDETNLHMAHFTAAANMLKNAKRLRNRNNYMSVDMEETLKEVRRKQHRSSRRASLVLEDTRNNHVKSQPKIYNHQSMLNLNREILDNRTYINDEFNNISNRLRHSESFDCGIGGSMYSWMDYNGDAQTDDESSSSKPWQKLCNGSVLRAVNQLSHKNSPKKKRSQSKTDLSGSRPDLSHSRTDILTPVDLKSSKSDLRMSKSDLKSSKSELRASRTDLKSSSKSELRGSKADLRSSKLDLRGSKQDLRGSKQDLRNLSQNDYRGSSVDVRGELRRTKDFCSSNHNISGRDTSWDRKAAELSFSRLDMSLSRLDLAHEQLNQEEELERLDTFRGDLTLPRSGRFSRPSLAPLLRGNAFHMSFRIAKSRRDKC